MVPILFHCLECKKHYGGPIWIDNVDEDMYPYAQCLEMKLCSIQCNTKKDTFLFDIYIEHFRSQSNEKLEVYFQLSCSGKQYKLRSHVPEAD